MSKISAMMDTGKRSLSNSQTALQTVGHNIANRMTEGYSRQRVETVTHGATMQGNARVGLGAMISGVTRSNNPWLEKQIQKETTGLGYEEGRAGGLGRVEEIYNEQNNKGLNSYMGDFFNSIRELANNPESMATRTLVRESAHALAKDFQRVDSQLKGVQQDLDGQLKVTVDEINELTTEIASLNEKVVKVETQNIPANDERDRRDLLLKKLGEKIDMTFTEGSDGGVIVTAANTAILVSGNSINKLTTKDGPEGQNLDIYLNATGSPTPITKLIKGGRIGGILDVRDNVVKDLQRKMDLMAFDFAKEVNKAHIEGYDKKGAKGVLLFDMPDTAESAARLIEVNKTVFNDISRIAVSGKPNAAGDNTVANIIANLQHRTTMEGGTTSYEDYYASQVGQIGAVAQRAIKSQESQKNIVTQLANIRESVSGVSLDEEATRMIEFQKSYDASARVIKTADEMFDTILSLKRL